ncbi:HAMP domain-containing histidine kinase [Candidatus Dojkabacteria bacterium]|nr:HAMP domain-containing histidine kinase [Candidatus Dojkabacteria bacterium]
MTIPDNHANGDPDVLTPPRNHLDMDLLALLDLCDTPLAVFMMQNPMNVQTDDAGNALNLTMIRANSAFTQLFRAESDFHQFCFAGGSDYQGQRLNEYLRNCWASTYIGSQDGNGNSGVELTLDDGRIVQLIAKPFGLMNVDCSPSPVLIQILEKPMCVQQTEDDRSIFRQLQIGLLNSLTALQMYIGPMFFDKPELEKKLNMIFAEIHAIQALMNYLNTGEVLQYDSLEIWNYPTSIRRVMLETPIRCSGKLLQCNFVDYLAKPSSILPVRVNPDLIEFALSSVFRATCDLCDANGNINIHVSKYVPGKSPQEQWRGNKQFLGIAISTSSGSIPEDQLANIFKANTSDAVSLLESHFGLYLSKKIVESHGGRISVMSNGCTATFIIWLPVDKHSIAINSEDLK